MKAFAIVNLKGGVGKTVTAVNLAAILATEYQRRVLLVDCDPQANATQSLLPPGEYNTLAGLLTIQDAYYDDLLYRSSIRGLDVLPADDELRNLDVDLLEGERPRLTALRDLRDAIAEVDEYDVLILDCPPALSPACAAAIAASTDVIIPIKVDAYSVRGMHELTAQIDRLRRIYPDVHIAGCLPTVWYSNDLAPGNLEHPEQIAKTLRCSADYVLGLTEELHPSGVGEDPWHWWPEEPKEDGLYWCVKGPLHRGGALYWWSAANRRWEDPAAGGFALNVDVKLWMACPALPESMAWERGEA